MIFYTSLTFHSTYYSNKQLHTHNTYMIHFGFSEEFEKIPSRHELQDDVDGIIVYAHAQYLQNVGMAEIPNQRTWNTHYHLWKKNKNK